MSATTSIQWCDCTVNPVMGCCGCELYPPLDQRQQVIEVALGSPRSDLSERRICYAGCAHDRKGQFHTGFAPEFLLPTLYRGRTAQIAKLGDLTGTNRPEKPWLDGLPRIIFVSDMGDALSDKPFGIQHSPGHYVWSHDVVTTVWGKDRSGRLVPRARQAPERAIQIGGVPFDFLKTEIIDVAMSNNGRRHQWLWLTKLPKRMAEFSRWLSDTHRLSWPANVWAGTSVTGTGILWRAEELVNVGDETTLRYLSVEPQWNEISLLDVFAMKPGGHWWVISGGESRQRKERTPRKLDLAWVRKLCDECRTLQIPFFIKQLGGNPQQDGQAWPLPNDPKHGGDWEDWPRDLRIREMPRVRGEFQDS